jgi:hypothetical protein
MNWNVEDNQHKKNQEVPPPPVDHPLLQRQNAIIGQISIPVPLHQSKYFKTVG